MKKIIGFILALALFAGTTSIALAASANLCPDSGKSMPELKMTADQKAKMISLKTQILELKKQIIKENLSNGTLTPEQAKKMEDRIDARLKQVKSGQLGHSFHRNHCPKATQQ